MKRLAIIPTSLGAVAVLHFALVYFLFQWLYGGKPKRFYFPYDLTLLQIAVSLCCIVILVPVLIRGDWAERLIGFALLVLPALILAVAAKELFRLFSFAYA